MIFRPAGPFSPPPKHDMHPHLQYATDVVDGRIATSDLVQLRCRLTLEEHDAGHPDWAFDPGAADAACNFVERCPHVQGRWAIADRRTGERPRIELPPWARFAIAELYGWWGTADPGLRRFNHGFLLVGKKNAKSTIFGAGLGLYETFCGQPGAQVLSCATKEEQAKLCWHAASKMVPLMPEISGLARVTVSHIYNDAAGASGSYFRYIGRKWDTSDGQNPTFVILDEAAAIQDRALVEVLEDSFGSQDAGLMLRITTGQPFDDTVFVEDMARISGAMRDGEKWTREFALFYRLNREIDDVDDPKEWIKANPNLGKSKSLPWMIEQHRKTLHDPPKRNAFLLKQLNVFTGVQEDQWLAPELWDALPEWDENAPPHIARVGAVDASQSQDISAVCWRWELPDRSKALLTWQCFAAEGSLDAVPDKHRQQVERIYRQAEERGELVLFKGQLVDWDAIEHYLRSEWQQFPWGMLGYDPYRATAPFIRLEEDGMPVVRIPNTMANLNAATARTKGMMKDGRYYVHHSPWLRWQYSNTAVYKDPKGQELIRHYTGAPWRKQDSMAALVMAERVKDANIEYAGESHFYVADEF